MAELERLRSSLGCRVHANLGWEAAADEIGFWEVHW
jgi:hypothetical protein